MNIKYSFIVEKLAAATETDDIAFDNQEVIF